MTCKLVFAIISNINHYFSLNDTLFANHYFLIDKLFIRNNLFEIVAPILIILAFLLIFKFLKLKSELNGKYAEHQSKSDSRNKENQFYFLFLGIIIPILEIIFAVFDVRSKSLLIQNFSLGLFLLAIYFFSKKSIIVFQNIQLIFKVLFILFFCIISSNLIYTSPDILPIIALLMCFFFSYDT